ncbi:hypothetical protein GCM10022284_27920 [Streptomyces hundungensis]
MVGAEEGVEAEVFGGLGDGEEGVVAGALLGLGEDAKIHASILHRRTAVNPVRATRPVKARSGEYSLQWTVATPLTSDVSAERSLARAEPDRPARVSAALAGASTDSPPRPPRGRAWAEEAAMSQEAVPEQTVPQQSTPQSAAGREGAPKGLLQQMEELMAALSADLTQLDADLQSTADRASSDKDSAESPRTEAQAHAQTPPQAPASQVQAQAPAQTQIQTQIQTQTQPQTQTDRNGDPEQRESESR